MNIHRGRARHALIILALSLTACGGGGGGTATGSSIPVTQATPTTGPVGPTGAMVSIPIHGMTPSVIAYQAGTSGTWTVVAPTGSNIAFTLPVGTTAYSVAVTCPFNASAGSTIRRGPAQEIIEATTTDSPDVDCATPLTNSQATVNATAFLSTQGVPNADSYHIFQTIPGTSFGVSLTGTAGADAFGSPLWYPGPSDIGVWIDNASFAPVSARLVRNVTVAPNSTLTFDPMTLTSDPVTTANITTPSGMTGGSAFWVPAEGGVIQLISLPQTTAMPLIPNATAGDYYMAQASGSISGQFLFSESAASTPTALNLTLPTSAFTYSNATPNGDLLSMNLSYSGFTATGTRIYEMNLSWPETTQPIQVGVPLLNIIATQSYLGTGTTVTVPDLSSVPGMFPKPSGGVSVQTFAQDYVVSGTTPWDTLAMPSTVLQMPLSNGTVMQGVQSSVFYYTAP